MGYKIDAPKIVINSVSKDGTTVEIAYQNVLKGLGNSVGNALRRTIITYIPGFAAKAYCLMGYYKFQPIANVIEDTIQLSVNIAGLQLAIDDDCEVDEVELNFVGYFKGMLKAKDLTVDKKYVGKIRILNPEHVLMNAGVKEEVFKNLIILCGRGVYHSTSNEMGKISDAIKEPEKFITVNSIYNPIISCNFVVKEGNTKFVEDVILTVRTTGAISPTEAIKYACNLLSVYFNMFASVSSIDIKESVSLCLGETGSNTECVVNTDKDTNLEEDFGINKEYPIEILNLCESTHNLLKLAGINTVDELVQGIKRKNIEEIFINKDITMPREEFVSKLLEIGIKSVENI